MGRGQAIRRQPVAGAIVEEVLGDPEPRVARDVVLRVLLAITADVDLHDPVEPLALGADHPLVAQGILDIDDGKQVGREARLGRAVDRELGGEVDPATLPGIVAAQRVERTALGLVVAVAFGHRDLGVGDLVGQLCHHPGALLRAERFPNLLAGRHRKPGWAQADRGHLTQRDGADRRRQDRR